MHKSQDQDRKHFQDTRNFPLASFNYPKGNHFSDFHHYRMFSLVSPGDLVHNADFDSVGLKGNLRFCVPSDTDAVGPQTTL